MKSLDDFYPSVPAGMISLRFVNDCPHDDIVFYCEDANSEYLYPHVLTYWTNIGMSDFFIWLWVWRSKVISGSSINSSKL